jgi:hypothetical protein
LFLGIWLIPAWGLIATHPVNIPCGRKPKYLEKTYDFRQSVDSHFSHGYHQGRRKWGGQEGQPPPLPFTRGGAKVPFQFKGLPCRNSELSDMLVLFFYEFASENARNAVMCNYSTFAWRRTPSYPYHPINRKHD